MLTSSRRENPPLKVSVGHMKFSRFLAPPVDHPDPSGESRPGWLASASRHWSLDQSDRR